MLPEEQKSIEQQAEEEGFPLDASYPNESEIDAEDIVNELQYDINLYEGKE